MDVIVGSPRWGLGNEYYGLVQIFSGRGSLGASLCVGELNSTGAAASLAVLGSPDPETNDVELLAADLPSDRFGVYLASQSTASVPNYGGGQGTLCLGAPPLVFSSAVQEVSAQGTLELRLELDNLPQGTVFQPGDTWNFQLWYRDVNPQRTSNLSSATAVTFQ